VAWIQLALEKVPLDSVIDRKSAFQVKRFCSLELIVQSGREGLPHLAASIFHVTNRVLTDRLFIR
jgi:hypothetical protein